MDGTYITTDHLILNSSSQEAHINLLIGTLRDEAAGLDSYPNTTNVALAIEYAGFNSTIYLDKPELFPIPDGSNATLDVFNVTSHFGSDAMARCMDQAIAYAGAKNSIFKSVWYYEFDRSYSANFFGNPELCNPHSDGQYPNGNPSMPYFRQVMSSLTPNSHSS